MRLTPEREKEIRHMSLSSIGIMPASAVEILLEEIDALREDRERTLALFAEHTIIMKDNYLFQIKTAKESICKLDMLEQLKNNIGKDLDETQ